MPREARDHAAQRQKLLTLLTDTGYDARVAERTALSQAEILSNPEAIQALNEWLKQYYRVMVRSMNISALAHYTPNEPNSPTNRSMEFNGQPDQYRILDLAPNDLSELIHEICHIIIAEPHELRDTDYGLNDGQSKDSINENEARTYIMQWYLLRQAGWSNRTLNTLTRYCREYINKDSWDGIDVDFPGKNELIEILKRA